MSAHLLSEAGVTLESLKAAAEGVRVKSLWSHVLSSAASCLGSSLRNGGGEERKVWAGLPGKGRPCCLGEGNDPGTYTQMLSNTPHTPYALLALEMQHDIARPRHKKDTRVIVPQFQLRIQLHIIDTTQILSAQCTHLHRTPRYTADM